MEDKIQTRRQSRMGRLHGAFAAEPMVVLHSSREAVVYGCKRILLYSLPQIRLSLGKRELVIFGSSLFCSSFSGGAVTVEGEIEGVRYEPTDAERKCL